MENPAGKQPVSATAGKQRRRLPIAAALGMLFGAGLLAACDDDADDRGGKGARTEPGGGHRPPDRPVLPGRR